MSKDETELAILKAMEAVASRITEESEDYAAEVLRDLSAAVNELAEAHAWLRTPAQPH